LLQVPESVFRAALLIAADLDAPLSSSATRFNPAEARALAAALRLALKMTPEGDEQSQLPRYRCLWPWGALLNADYQRELERLEGFLRLAKSPVLASGPL
jgi:hypothetical protein